jgi:hypothetical protein
MNPFQAKFSFSPEIWTVYRSDRDCHTKSHGKEALIAVSETVFDAKRRYDLEYFQEYIWVEFSVIDGHNLPVGNHYFAPDIKVDIIKNYLKFLENVLDTCNCNCNCAWGF